MPIINKEARILIVEDDEFLLNIYLTSFKKEGFNVFTAKTGEEGLKLAVQEKPNVILLDILLPGEKNGLDVMKSLASKVETAEIPVMIMSNLADDITISEGMALGAKGYFIKSQFSPKDVVRNVLTFLK
jgi:two-component system alkaline phosphatase synthesis response regulator PhoP